jgi:phosphatidylserine/phosphatidylglycerophosphate/cardiolipin synthase-like enzyme
MAQLFKIVFLLILAVSLGSAEYSDPSYDHQTTTYTSHIEPVTLTQKDFIVTPFFSPDHSTGVQTGVIQNAKEYVNLGCPSFSSWLKSCSNSTGCSPTEQRSETFPVWQALLNALHSGVKVNILINDYNETDLAPGNVGPLSFLILNGANVRFFTTLTFLHAKYIGTDSQASVSSVNFDYTSYMLNREAGVVLSGEDAMPLIQLYNSTFWEDWDQAFDLVLTQKYSSSEMSIITNPAPVEVVIPPPRDLGTYVTPLVNVSGDITATAFVSPDYAYNLVSESLNATKYSVYLYMYDTDGEMCDLLQTLSSSIVKNSMILVSATIDGSGAYDAAQACYKDLYDYGYTIKTAPSAFSYAHQKYWIIDYGHPEANMFVTSGNWDDEDLPDGSGTFPPYSSSSWRDTNRDVNFGTNNTDIMNVFYTTLSEDYKDGNYWKPSN